MKVTVYISPPSLKPNLTTQKYKKVNGPKIRNPFIDQASPAHLLPATLFPPKTHRRSKKALIPHSPFRHHNIPQREKERKRDDETRCLGGTKEQYTTATSLSSRRPETPPPSVLMPS